MTADSDSIEVPRLNETLEDSERTQVSTPKHKSRRSSSRPSSASSSSRTSHHSRRSSTSESPRTPHSRRSSSKHHHRSPKRSPHSPSRSSHSSRRSGSSSRRNFLPQGLPLDEDESTRSQRRSSTSPKRSSHSRRSGSSTRKLLKSSNDDQDRSTRSSRKSSRSPKRSSESPPMASPHSSRRSGSSSTRNLLLPQGLPLDEDGSSRSHRKSSKSPKRSSHSKRSSDNDDDLKKEEKIYKESASTAVGAHHADASTSNCKSLSKEKSRRSSRLRIVEASSPYSPNGKEKYDVSKQLYDSPIQEENAYIVGAHKADAKSARKSVSKEKSPSRSSKLRAAEASSPYSPNNNKEKHGSLPKALALDPTKQEISETMEDESENDRLDIEANSAADEAHEKSSNKRKKLVVCLCLLSFLAIIGGVVAFFMLRSKDDDSPETLNDSIPDLNATASPRVPTAPPTIMGDPNTATLPPTPVGYRPSKEDCDAVADRLPVLGQDDLFARSFGVVLDVTLDDSQRDPQTTMDFLVEEIQRFLMPLLIGCVEDDNSQRALQEADPNIQDDERYIVANGYVSWAPSTLEELDTCESEMCLGGTFNLDLFMRDESAKYLTIVKLMSAVFGSDLVDLLQLQAPYVSVVLRAVINKEPTPSPSIAPSTLPSLMPSEEPSAMPVTTAPTKKPSPRPTIAPAVGVTQQPTSAPSPKPSPSPTRPPTPSPTGNPTPPPTPGPTVPPTSEPTTAPPTVAPVASPTVSPPTTTSTTAPAVGRTLSPTSGPTFAPTFVPTFYPTVVPTNAPTVEPTFEPTSQPTNHPTLVPTSAPTSAPISGPTLNPTSSPTSEPTLEPTLSPTSSPTLAPVPVTPAPTVCPRYPSTATLVTTTTRQKCSSHFAAGLTSNGYYPVNPSGSGSSFVVYCNQDTGGYALFASHENMAAIYEVSVVTPCDIGVLNYANWSVLYNSMTTGMWGEDEFGNRSFVSALTIIIMSGGYLWDLPSLINTFYDPAQHGQVFKIYVK